MSDIPCTFFKSKGTEGGGLSAMEKEYRIFIQTKNTSSSFKSQKYGGPHGVASFFVVF